jgi:antitoxin CcdA
MKHERVPDGKRRIVEVEVDGALLDDARTLGIDLDRVAARALEAEVARERDRRWQEEHRGWIEAHRRWVETHELPLERYRLF